MRHKINFDETKEGEGKKFEHQHKSGEWFSLNMEDIKYIQTFLES